MEEDILLKLENVEICREENRVLHDACLTLRNGEFVYVIGKVGSGKSSLLKSLYCEIPILRGEARIMDYNLTKMKRKDIPYLRRKLGIVFQDFQLLTDRSVSKNLEFVLKATGWKKKSEIKERIDNVLRQVGMQDKGYNIPVSFPAGSASVLRSRGQWRQSRRSSWRTSRPAIWTRRRADKSYNSYTTSASRERR